MAVGSCFASSAGGSTPPNPLLDTKLAIQLGQDLASGKVEEPGVIRDLCEQLSGAIPADPKVRCEVIKNIDLIAL